MCHLLALLGAHPILHVSGIRIKVDKLPKEISELKRREVKHTGGNSCDLN